jgi:CRP-like cAMP-binding protein
MPTNSDITKKVRDFFTAYPLKTFHKDEVIVQAGEAPAGVFYLVEGRVSQYDISPSGIAMVVNVFKPPAFFPMSWAINKTPNLYFFEATVKVTARKAPAEDVVAFLRENPDVLFDLLARVYRGADGMIRRMAHLMGGDSKSRLQFELLNAAHRFGDPHPSGKIYVPLKENDLARHSGLARETVSRNLRALKAAGLVEVSHQGFVLLDIAGLEAELGSSL